MSQTRIKGEPGFILHRRPYSESSLLVDIFSRHHGRLTAIAKGARGLKSAFRGMIRPFALTTLGWSGKGEVKTLTQCEWAGPDFDLKGPGLYCGFYINELLLKFIQRYDPHERLFDQYLKSIIGMNQGESTQGILRVFEKALLNETGYGLQLERDHESGEALQPEQQYQYRPGMGAFVRISNETGGVMVRGSSLIALRNEHGFDETALRELKHLHRAVFQYLLDGKTLASRMVFSRIYSAEVNRAPDGVLV
ncbi:MAG: DNA repair protein RecO [Arenicellales bacterium]